MAIVLQFTTDEVSVYSAGGTFEKVYPTGAGARTFVFGAASAAEEMIDRLRLSNVDLECTPHLFKDSLDMTDADRAIIAAWCAAEPADALVVIHGTDTMVETAKYLASCQLPKTIILTGSLQPACVQGSDAESNFVSAILASRLMGRGIWICMHGQLFPYDGCRKNPETGYFEAVEPVRSTASNASDA